MSDNSVDREHLTAKSPEDLLKVPLNVGMLTNSRGDLDRTELICRLFGVETRWRTYPFEGLEHAQSVVPALKLDVFVTHWHLGWSHDLNNPVTVLVNSLKDSRATAFEIGSTPLLIGTYRSDSDYFDRNFLHFLESTYDSHLSSVARYEELCQCITDELWLRLPTNVREWARQRPTSESTCRTAIIIDDHEPFRHALGMALRPLSYAALASFTGQRLAVEELTCMRPSVVLMDVDSAGTSGLELLLSLRKSMPELDIVVFALKTWDEAKVLTLLRAGANAVVNRQQGLRHVRTAVQCSMAGKLYLCSMTAGNRWNETRNRLGVARLADLMTAEDGALFSAIAKARYSAQAPAHSQRFCRLFGIEYDRELAAIAKEWLEFEGEF